MNRTFPTFGLIGFALLSACCGQAKAAVITLDFEGLKDGEAINNYYNGGLGSLGSGPGPADGITFTSDSLAIISKDASGTGNFNHLPSGVTIAYFLTGAGDTMNVAGGFTTGFSFFYSAAFNPGVVKVYSGPNGTGSLMTTLNLTTTIDKKYGTYDYDDWEPIGVSFGGTAQSVVFAGTANQIGFDNITLGSQTPTGVPEPGAVTLMASLVIAGAGLLRRRNR